MVVQDYSIKHVFVDREKELGTLDVLLKKVQVGRGQIVTIMGEHGIGKTKLVEEFRKLVEDEQNIQIQFYYGRCRRTAGRDPYQPFTEALKYNLPTAAQDLGQMETYNPESDKILAISDEDVSDETNKDSDNGSTMNPVNNEDSLVKAKPLGLIPFGEPLDEDDLDIEKELEATIIEPPVVEPLPMGLIPAAFRTTEVGDIKKRRSYLYDTITKHIFKLCKSSPVVLIIDDFQWINPASRGYLQYLAERIRNKPIMLLFLLCSDEINEIAEKKQAINELLQSINTLEYFTTITLERFGQKEVGTIIKKIFSREDVPESFIEQMYNKTEGNPLYIDDTIRALIEEDIIDISSYVWQTRIDLTDLRIHESTRETIINRLSTLDKNVLKVLSYASVIGREFTFDLLARLSEIQKEELLDYIDIILESKLIIEDLSSDEDLYRFGNPIILDIAYSQLSRSRRRFLHTKLGNILEQMNINNIGKVVFTLANHYSKGWEYDKALKYLILAGDNALQIYAINDARKYYQSALETLNKFDYTIEIQQREIDLLGNLGYTCEMLGDWDQALEYYSNIPKLIENLQNKMKETGQTLELDADKSEIELIPANWIQLKTADTYWNLAEIMRYKSSWEKAEQYYKLSLQIAQEIEDYHGIAQAERGRGYINWRQGNYKKALDHYDICIDFATKINDLPVIAVTYIDIGNIYNYLGEWEQANAYYTESLEHLSKIGWLHEMGRAFNGLGDINFKQENWESAIENFESAEEISIKIGDSYNRGYALFNSAICHAKMNKYEIALKKCKLAKEILERLEDRAGLATVYKNFGMIFHYKQNWSKSEKYFKKGLEILKNLKLPYESGQVYLEYGQMLKSKGLLAEAKRYFVHSLEIFKSVDAKREIVLLEEILKSLKVPKKKSFNKMGIQQDKREKKNEKVVS
ncbi:tetratricopeptide repeat protein [[Eubacterium] cellulosolvens]